MEKNNIYFIKFKRKTVYFFDVFIYIFLQFLEKLQNNCQIIKQQEIKILSFTI